MRFRLTNRKTSPLRGCCASRPVHPAEAVEALPHVRRRAVRGTRRPPTSSQPRDQLQGRLDVQALDAHACRVDDHQQARRRGRRIGDDADRTELQVPGPSPQAHRRDAARGRHRAYSVARQHAIAPTPFGAGAPRAAFHGESPYTRRTPYDETSYQFCGQPYWFVPLLIQKPSGAARTAAFRALETAIRDCLANEILAKVARFCRRIKPWI